MIAVIPISTDHVRDRLSEYEAAVGLIEVHFSQPVSPGRVPVGPAYFGKHAIPAMIDASGDSGAKRHLRHQYERITARLSSIERLHGPGLRENLMHELRYRVDTWHSAICHMNLGNLGAGEVSGIIGRETTVALVEELRIGSDISDIERAVMELDEATREAEILRKHRVVGCVTPEEKDIVTEPAGSSGAPEEMAIRTG